jgi:flap endonuclease-1
MGVNLGDIIEKEETELENLQGNTIAVDGQNTLYQFISIIRQPDGTPLMDRKGNITSHLTGLFYRTINVVFAGIRPVFVFDGKPPDLKIQTLQERKAKRESAKEAWREALKEGDIKKAYTKATQSSRLTKEMVEEAKRLLTLMGLPVVQAPAEGEGQAAYMAKKGQVWAAASQDYDSLLFGTPILIRNITITGRRKIPRKDIYIDVKPELIRLQDVFNKLEMNQDQLIELALMVGTDFNSGVKGVGPKKALAFIKKGLKAEQVYNRFEQEPGVDLDQVRNIFKNPETTDEFTLEWKSADREGVLKFLVDEHDFSHDRIQNGLDKMARKQLEKGTQSKLNKWF